jgi:hypothetical protein
MKNVSPLKRKINWNFWIPATMFLLFLIIEDRAFGTFYTSWLYGLSLIIIGIIYSARYKLYQPALILSLAGITLWHYVLASHYDTCLMMIRSLGLDISSYPGSSPFSMLTWMINLLILFLLIAIMGPLVIKALRLEQSANQIFKTAAKPVISSGNGFTSRPFYAGNAEYSKEQITGFSQYLEGQMIVYPVYSETGVFLTFSMGKSPVAVKESSEISYITFENTGKIIVHIAFKDYKKFRKQLTFDHLCESLGDLFKRFLNYYVHNQESRILSELKSTQNIL